jgi:hypothetical protein
MNKTRSVTWGLVVATAFVATAAIPACELIVSFDRSKIPQDSGFGDVTLDDVQNPVDGGQNDGGQDMDRTVADTGADSSSEAGEGGPPDARADTGSFDARADTGSVDAFAETGSDGSPDAPAETGIVDTGTDTGTADAPVETGDDGSGDADDGSAAPDGDDSG